VKRDTSQIPKLTTKARAHRGDIMSPEKRSALMSRIRGKHTGPERALLAALATDAIRWEQHSSDLPGKPDFVCRDSRVVVFVDGDFWHGWRFSTWRHKLSPAWEAKIARNRTRDLRNHRRLRRMGWKVIRIWEHQLEKDLSLCVIKIVRACRKTSTKRQEAPRRCTS
jgi:DNA mismatch endonuclease, patch repair protein